MFLVARRIRLLSRTAFKVLIITLLICAGLETLLRLTDPTGVYVRQVDWHIFYNHLQPHETGYRLPAGTLHMTGYSATINPDGTRHTPDTATGVDCTIAAVGDSMTFGMGVDDTDTWVNLLARRFPDIRFTNTGRPRYNVLDTLALINHYDADGYLYLHIQNDDWINDWQYWLSRGYVEPYKPALYYYYHELRGRVFGVGSPITDEKMHRTALATIRNRGDVLMLAFENDLLLDRLPEETVLIRWHNHRISQADGHPTAAGHRQMAEDMLPAVRTFIEGICI